MLNYWLDTDQEDHDEAQNLSDSLKVGQLRQTSICIPFGRFLFFLEARSEKPLAFVYRKTPAPRLTTPRPRPIISLSQPSAGTGRQPCLPECHQTFSSSHLGFLSSRLRLPPIRSSKAGIYVVGSEDRFAGGSTPSL